MKFEACISIDYPLVNFSMSKTVFAQVNSQSTQLLIFVMFEENRAKHLMSIRVQYGIVAATKNRFNMLHCENE